MILDQFPTLRGLDTASQMQLSAELWDLAMDAETKFTPGVLAALEERVAYNEDHPDEVFTAGKASARLADLKREIDARRNRG